MNGAATWLEIGKVITDWLNGGKAYSSPAYERVSTLIEGLHGLEPLLREHPLVSENEDGTTPYVGTSPGALLRDAVNAQLAEYQFKPTLIVTGANNVRVKWLSKDGTGEASIIELVSDLFNVGKLGMVGKCEVCKRWLVMTKADRKFCSPKCRSNFYARTDKGRQYHGAKAREQHERKRKPLLGKVSRVLKEWERKPLKAGADWKAKMVQRVPEVSKAFLTRAVKNGELREPAAKLYDVRVTYAPCLKWLSC